MSVLVVGAGPAGLMAAETARAAGAHVTVCDAMPSAGRKLLIAGSSGLNLTHAEPLERFLDHYGDARGHLEPYVRAFGPERLRAWALELGIATFVGSSGRVFPEGMLAAPLLKAWLARLVAAGVEFRWNHRWTGWDEHGAARLEAAGGTTWSAKPAALVLALGGASWPQTGSTGAWKATLEQRGVEVAPFRPANCGFLVAWSEVFRAKFAGHPVKSVAVVLGPTRKSGELLVTEEGLQGSLVYAFAARFRDELEATGKATLVLDLAPDLPQAELARRWGAIPAGRSVSTHLEKAWGLKGVKAGLLREATWPTLPNSADALARAVKNCRVTLLAPRPLAEAISSAGGVSWSEVDGLEVRRLPGVFCAGEMLDWEAPTGGYLLTACWATGHAAGEAAARLSNRALPGYPAL